MGEDLDAQVVHHPAASRPVTLRLGPLGCRGDRDRKPGRAPPTATTTAKSVVARQSCPWLMAVLDQRGPGLGGDADDRDQHSASTPRCQWRKSRPAGVRCLPLVVVGPVAEDGPSGSPWSGSSASSLSTPCLELGGDPGEGQAGRPARRGGRRRRHRRPAAPPPNPSGRLAEPGIADPSRVVRRGLPAATRRRSTWASTSAYSGVVASSSAWVPSATMLPAVEQDDPVGQADGRQPVGDDQRGPALHQDPQARRGSPARPGRRWRWWRRRGPGWAG